MVHDTQIEIAYGMILTENDDSGLVIPVPVLSGIKFFDSLNPLANYTPTVSKCDDDDENDNNSTLLLFSGDSMKPSLNLAMDCLENRVLGGSEEWVNGQPEVVDECSLHPPIRKVIVGGCGHKILSLQRHAQLLAQQQIEG